jgi:hypothetical protein
MPTFTYDLVTDPIFIAKTRTLSIIIWFLMIAMI